MTAKIVLNSEQKQFIKENLLNKVSLENISKQLGISVDVLSREVKNIMGPDFSLKHKSYVNIHYFENINTPEKAYWLGFLSADGYVVGNELNIQLQKQDKKHLQKFSEALNGNLTVRDINGTNNLGTKYNAYRVGIRSQKLIDDLAKYNIVPHKSLIFTVPDNIPNNLYDYWIIGYMDGDGSITKNKKKIRICFTGTYQVMEFIKEHLNSQAVISLEHRCDSTYKLQLENDISKDFLDKINYKNLEFALERKKQIFALYSSLM